MGSAATKVQPSAAVSQSTISSDLGNRTASHSTPQGVTLSVDRKNSVTSRSRSSSQVKKLPGRPPPLAQSSFPLSTDQSLLDSVDFDYSYRRSGSGTFAGSYFMTTMNHDTIIDVLLFQDFASVCRLRQVCRYFFHVLHGKQFWSSFLHNKMWGALVMKSHSQGAPAAPTSPLTPLEKTFAFDSAAGEGGGNPLDSTLSAEFELSARACASSTATVSPPSTTESVLTTACEPLTSPTSTVERKGSSRSPAELLNPYKPNPFVAGDGPRVAEFLSFVPLLALASVGLCPHMTSEALLDRATKYWPSAIRRTQRERCRRTGPGVVAADFCCVPGCPVTNRDRLVACVGCLELFCLPHSDDHAKFRFRASSAPGTTGCGEHDGDVGAMDCNDVVTIRLGSWSVRCNRCLAAEQPGSYLSTFFDSVRPTRSIAQSEGANLPTPVVGSDVGRAMISVQGLSLPKSLVSFVRSLYDGFDGCWTQGRRLDPITRLPQQDPLTSSDASHLLRIVTSRRCLHLNAIPAVSRKAIALRDSKTALGDAATSTGKHLTKCEICHSEVVCNLYRCLSCGVVLCGAAGPGSGHMYTHSLNTGHLLIMNLDFFGFIWCYSCDRFVGARRKSLPMRAEGGEETHSLRTENDLLHALQTEDWREWLDCEAKRRSFDSSGGAVESIQRRPFKASVRLGDLIEILEWAATNGDM